MEQLQTENNAAGGLSALTDVLELLPCPFCGSDDVHHTIDKADDEYEFVMCNGCGAGVSRADSLPERRPIEVWNMRSNASVQPPAPGDELESTNEADGRGSDETQS